MGSLRSARFRSILSAFILTTVFALYQNFIEIRVDPNSYQYQLVELKHLSNKSAESLAFGITSKGEVIGQSRGDDGLWHTVHWAVNGEVKDLGVRTEFNEEKTGIFYAQPFSPKGVWIGPTAKEFGKRDNNCHGECKLLGELAEEMQLGYQKSNDLQTGFLRVRGKSTGKIAPVGKGKWVFPNSVNSRSEVVGSGTTDDNEHAFLWREGRTIDLGSLHGGSSRAFDINDLGQIVGETSDEKSARRPVIWSVVDGKVSALDLTHTINRSESAKYQGRANGINNDGEVVGLLKNEQENRPFLWTAEQGIKDLNTMTKGSDPLNSEREWILEDGRGINNCGHIITWGQKIGKGHGYSVLLKPVSSKPGCT